MIVRMTTRERGPVTIVSVNGSLSRIERCRGLSELTRELVQAGSKWILVDLAGITSIDSFGVGDLMIAFAAVRNAGGEMKLLNANSSIRRLLQLTRLNAVFEMYDDESTAVLSFVPARPYTPFEDPSEIYVG